MKLNCALTLIVLLTACTPDHTATVTKTFIAPSVPPTAKTFVAPSVSPATPPITGVPESIYDEIRREALAPNSETEHPLPLVGSWNAGSWWNFNTADAGFYPGWQLEMADQGHHLLPWFEIPTPDQVCEQSQPCVYIDYFEEPIKNAAKLNLPISFIGTEWEHYFYDDPAYLNLPPDENPNVVTVNGTVEKKISPFGPVKYWDEVGKRWGASAMMQQVIRWYPSPPMVIFFSNNEANRLTWKEIEMDRRYVEQYGKGHDDNFKRKVLGDAWKVRYTALINGFRDGLGNSHWQANAHFFAYQAFGYGWLGSWNGWKDYSLYIPGRIDPNPLYWQGGSSSLYIYAQSNFRDNNVQGPLFSAMNWVFILDEAYKLNPSFWYEFSTWDGGTWTQKLYALLGQKFTPERYGGFVQYAMWLVRPRVVRIYRNWDEARTTALSWATPVIEAVDRVYDQPVLEKFWRSSTLVTNTSHTHPYQRDFPDEYKKIDRLYLLETSLGSPRNWTLDTEFPVMSLARVRGERPNRQWLLYAYAPLGSQTGVSITIPNYDKVTVDVNLGGSFYLVDEASKTVAVIR